jgi:phage shock protein B
MCDVTTILLALIIVLGPTWLTFTFLNNLVRSKSLNKRDAETLAQVAAIATRIEARMDVVERILDAETPSWRENAATLRKAG